MGAGIGSKGGQGTHLPWTDGSEWQLTKPEPETRRCQTGKTLVIFTKNETTLAKVEWRGNTQCVPIKPAFSKVWGDPGRNNIKLSLT